MRNGGWPVPVQQEPERSSGTDPGAALTGPGTAPVAAGTDAADDLVAACGQVRFDSIPADPSLPPLGDGTWNKIDLGGLGVEAEFFDVHDWSVASETADTLRLLGVPQRAEAPEPSYGYATFARDGERWVPEGWGGCRITVEAPGWGNAHFVLDPDAEPDPAANELAVQAWEVGCANGQPPEGREVRPVILSEDGESVSIVVLVEPVTGGASCPGNPSFPLEIALDEPIGDRTVYDASLDPALERPWPPSESSVSSQGRDA